MKSNLFDWNLLSMYSLVYVKYISPFWATYVNPTLLQYGIIESFHSLVTTLVTWLSDTIPYFLPKLNVIFALTMAFKFLCLIALLIFIRGGVPRYRYDFLTKIGWIKFLSLVLSVFLTSLLLTLLI